MAASRRLLWLGVVLGVASCGVKTEHITHLDVKVSWAPSIVLDQIRFEVLDGATTVVPGATLPQPAGNVLSSGQRVAILLSDGEVGKSLLVRTTGVFQGKDVQWGDVSVTPVLRSGVPAVITLSHSPTAVLSSIAVTGANMVLAQGATAQLTAIGAFSDGTSTDITTTVSWTSSMPAIASVGNAAPSQGLVTALSEGSSTITCALGGVTGTVKVSVSAAKLQSITVTPANPLVATGATLALMATGNYSDGTMPDLTSSVTWATSDSSVATVDPDGTLHGLMSGSVIVTATLNNINGTDIVAVTQATLQQIMIGPASVKVAAGSTPTLVATGVFTDRSTADVTSSVTWSSSDMTVATVSNDVGTKGQVLAVAAGTVTITATQGGVSGTTQVTVTQATLASISVTPIAPILAGGTTLQMTATGTYSDKTTQDLTGAATWSSSATNIATVRSDAGFGGQVNALSTGSTTITAMFSGISGSTPLGVTAATLTSIAISPSQPSIAKGTSVQLTATGTFSDGTTQNMTGAVAWGSNNASVAMVSNAAATRGLATSVTPGMATVTATLNTVSGSTLLTVTAAQLTGLSISSQAGANSLANGTTLQLTATGLYSDGTSQDQTAQVTWTSSAPASLDVSNAAGTHGLATGKKLGMFTVTASLGTTMANTPLTVTAATLSSLSVSPTNPTIAKGTTQKFTLTATYSDGTSPDVTSLAAWAASPSPVASVSSAGSSAGTATGTGTGNAQISASYGGLTVNTTLTVTTATLVSIAISPPTPSLAKGTSTQLQATGTYSDTTTQDLTKTVTWSTTALPTAQSPLAATVSNAAGSQGLLTGVLPGTTATVTAQTTVGTTTVSGTATVTVTAATVTSISLSPPSVSLAKGTTQQVTASAVYSDNSVVDVTNTATWATVDNTIAGVTTAGSSGRGLVSGTAKGTTTLNVSMSNGAGGTASTSAVVTVTDATLTSISVTATSLSLVDNTSRQFTATGTYSDHTQADVTQSANWASDTTSVATVTNASGNKGVVKGVGVGSANISATIVVNGNVNIVGSAQVTINAATLLSIAVTPTNATVPAGNTQQFTATATYDDNSTPDVTTMVTWSSSSGAATISNGTTDHGLATTMSVGTPTITAKLGSVSGSTTLTVSQATLMRVDISPATPSIAKGSSQQFTATAVYSDNSTVDVTTTAAWSSSMTSVASIASGTGSGGLATGLTMGTSSIQATYNQISSMATTLTVTPAVLNTINITPTPPTIAVNTQVLFSATGVYSDGTNQPMTASWLSSNPGVVSVAGSGLATAVSPGNTVITATSPDGKVTGQLSLTVSAATLTSIVVAPASATVPLGTTQAFTATGTFSDTSTQDITGTVTWGSSATNIATIDNSASSNHGVATPVAAGSTTITATMEGVTSPTVTLTVTSAALKSISITPASLTLPVGYFAPLVCNAVYVDNSTSKCTRRSTWSSGDPSVSVSNATGSNGIATAVSAGGAVTITASFTVGGVTKIATASVTPTNETLQTITITPPTPAVVAGLQQQFTAQGSFSSGSMIDLTTQVTWGTDNMGVANISNATATDGLATTFAMGTANISASIGAVSSSVVLTVNAAQLLSISVTPANATYFVASVSNPVTYTAIGRYTDSSMPDISAMCTWMSDNPTVADFDTTPVNALDILSVGSANITATLGAISGMTGVLVEDAASP